MAMAMNTRFAGPAIARNGLDSTVTPTSIPPVARNSVGS